MFEVCCRLCLEQVPLQNIHSLYGKHKDFLIRDKIYELFQIRVGISNSNLHSPIIEDFDFELVILFLFN